MQLQLSEPLFCWCHYTHTAATTHITATTHVAATHIVVASAALAVMSVTTKNYWNTLNCNCVIWKTIGYCNLTTKILLYWMDLCVLTHIIVCINLSWILTEAIKILQEDHNVQPKDITLQIGKIETLLFKVKPL